MSTTPSDDDSQRQPCDPNSLDCIDLIIDRPGDTTVRPCRPELLPFLMAEREKLARWLPLLAGGEANEKPIEGQDKQNGVI
jgi:hypothetical protein